MVDLPCDLFDGISQDDLLFEKRDFVSAEKAMVSSGDTEAAKISSSSVPIYFLEAAPERMGVEVRSEIIDAAIASCNQVFRELARHNVGEAAAFSVGVSKALPIVASALPSVEELSDMLPGIQVDSAGVVVNLHKVDSVPSSVSSIVTSEEESETYVESYGIRLSVLDKAFIRAVDRCINASDDPLEHTVEFIYSFLKTNNDDAIEVLGEECCSAALEESISKHTPHYLALLNKYYFEIGDDVPPLPESDSSDAASCFSDDDDDNDDD